MSNVIQLDALTKDYLTDAGAVPVLKGVSLAVNQGEFVAIMGPSGSGKSTLMNILGCLDIPSGGRYLLNDTDIGTLAESELARLRGQVIGFVFQGFNLLPRMSLGNNVALPLVYQHIGKPERLTRATDMLEKVGLGHLVNSLPTRISGGQQQRVAIARALVTRPSLILADEPTGNLDSHTGREIMELFQRINREQSITIVLVTHDMTVARYAQRLVYLKDGLLAYDGPMSDFHGVEA
ncbi:putative ABC transporter ATP-binding protein YknY [Ferriphaselus amnicola]|uniref:Putative ABC transporter ATP-binding protein YknY n=1 Tax=Ferriphaselus amnicola TaxID=1188319 RepID=A0A2Z6GEE0_9PROT|nr:ABC transporter ATP-binding protein [Ferriphaselus amnicola]BBE51702.1 putative ABC transporter ATP-binding protein YknY [Ferriphaselus amnicola]